MISYLPRGRHVPRVSALASALAAVAVLCLSGCLAYPDSSERIDDDIVFTARAPQADFATFKTFSIDPVVHLAKVLADGSIEPGMLDPTVSAALVAQVVLNMTQRGYVQVDSTAKPNLGLTLTTISGLTVGVVSGGYYWGYYGYYWGYPGWGYYYPYNVAYSYRTGTLIVDMVDLAKSDGLYPRDGGLPVVGDAGPPPPGALPVVWTAAAYKADVDVDNITNAGTLRAQQAIDQAFKQSPYLRSN